MPPFLQTSDLIRGAIDARVTPGASIEAGSSAGARWRASFGTVTYAQGADRVEVGTMFDLASLTKVLATTTLAAGLVMRGALCLDDLVQHWLPEWATATHGGQTVRDLLEHASGLPAHLPLYESCVGPGAFRAAIAAAALAYEPRTQAVYSDLGFMALGWVLEACTGRALDAQWRAFIAAQGGAADDEAWPAFRPPSHWRHRMAPTRYDAWRGRQLRGEVDDNNAWAMGGVAGHAGLFGTAAAVGRLAQTWLSGVDRHFLNPSEVPGSSRACGWDLMRPTSSCGTRMSGRAFGHTGFTGTSLWIDPERDWYVVLLTNRVHPEAGIPDGIQSLRRAVHDAMCPDR